jgi:hypothetical protein
MKRIGFLLLAGFLTACGQTPLPAAATPDPSDPNTPTVEAPYRPVLAGTAAHRPVAPKSWRELNERVAPKVGRR